MPIKLFNAGTNESLDSLYNINLPPYYAFLSTKTARKGKWYFEYKHHSGTKRCVIGFRSINDSNEATITSDENKFRFYTQYSKFINFNLDSTEDEYTAGIGFDLDDLLFFFRVDQEMRVLNVSQYIAHGQQWTAVVRQRNMDNVNDKVDINFGASSFHYPVPFDFVPWEKNPKRITCHQSLFRVSSPQTTLFILISLK